MNILGYDEIVDIFRGHHTAILFFVAISIHFMFFFHKVKVQKWNIFLGC